MFEERLEDVAQTTGTIDYSDAWKLNAHAEADKDFRKKVRAALALYEDAAIEGDEVVMEEAGNQLKVLAKEIDKKSGNEA
jgi:hypothetical protein